MPNEDGKVPTPAKPATARGRQPASPEKTLLSVLGKCWVTTIAIAALIGAVGLSLVAVFAEHRIYTTTAHAWLCVLAAFFFSVFVFTLFPANYHLPSRLSTAMSLALVGPAALWVALTLFFMKLIPAPQQQMQTFWNLQSGFQPSGDAMWIIRWDTEPKGVFLLQPPQRLTSTTREGVHGIGITFADGISEHRAQIGFGPTSNSLFQTYEVVFKRGSKDYAVVQLPTKRGE